jgi:ectoine hydroxylase-related dioxygenase (phytanoyl-CoA dioxygenase family)
LAVRITCGILIEMTDAVKRVAHDTVAQFRRDGFIVVRQLLTRDEAALIRDAFMAMNANGPVEGLSETRRQHAGGRSGYDPSDPLAFYPRMMHPHRHLDKPVGPIALRYMLDPRIESILIQLMGEPVWAAQSMFYFKPPRSRGQDFHQDNFYLKVKPGTCVAAWVALDRCDDENGGMMCVPETGDYPIQCPERADAALYFTSDHVPIPDGKSAILPILEPGDVLFFNGSVIHGSGPNRSKDRFRRSIIFHYLPQSATQISNWYEVVDFNGNRVTSLEHNPDGGPCGTMQGQPAAH